MDKLKEILEKSKAVHHAIDSRDAEAMATSYSALEKILSEDFDTSRLSLEELMPCFEGYYAAIRYLSHNNFYEKAKQLCTDMLVDKDAIKKLQLDALSKTRMEEILSRVEDINRALPAKHKNLTIPRADTVCCLCRIRPANKTGSHMVPNFLAHPSFSWDGKGKRFREALDRYSLNDPTWNSSYYGSEVSAERIARSLGHEMTDEEIDNNINLLEFDNEFCTVCEDRFGILETAYANYYNHKEAKISPKVAYLFWLSVLWRMSLGRMGLFMNLFDEFDIEGILDDNILESVKAIDKSTEDLGDWQYALFRAEGLKAGDKGILGSRIEHAPYVTAYNDLVMVFYPHVPSDGQLKIGPIVVERENLNNWHKEEKEVKVDRRWFWDVRDWIADTAYDYYDPMRESCNLKIREKERSIGESLDREKLTLYKELQRQIAPKPLLRFRKWDRIYIAYLRQVDAKEKGEFYDPLQDEQLFLCEKDFQCYYKDLARLSRGGVGRVEQSPFYEQAKAYLPSAKKWKASGRAMDEEYSMLFKAYLDFISNYVKSENRKQLLDTVFV